MTSKNIVIVEDEKIVALDIKSSLENLGYNVAAVATSGKTALKKVAETQPDLVLMDIQLRGEMDGVQTAERIRDNFNIPVIYLTANADSTTLHRAKVTEPYGYILKPFEEKELNISIEMALYKHQQESQAKVRERHQALKRTEQLEIQMAELQKLNQLKDDFMSTISHELRTPMTSIQLATQMLEVGLNKTVPQPERSQLTRYIQILNDECKREVNLINDLLDLRRLDAGNLRLNLDTINLQTWLPQVVQPFEVRTQNRQQLQVNLDPTLPAFICDPFVLERILAELLNNACKYTPKGEKITVTASLQSGMIQLKVSNSGVEIPTSELPHIFDKFYRIPSADPWKQGGTGLGLALVKNLTEHLGGCISVESTSQETCFTVEIPYYRN